MSLENIHTVLFDMSDVACHFRPERRLGAFATETGIPSTRIHDELWGSGFSHEADCGRYGYAQMVEEINGRLGSSLTEDRATELWSIAFKPNSEVLDIASRLSVYRVGLFTNNAPILREALDTHLPELEEHFDPIIFSYELSATKPDPGIFSAVAQRMKVDPNAILLIDDSATNVSAARKAGWHSIQFLSTNQLESDLIL